MHMVDYVLSFMFVLLLTRARMRKSAVRIGEIELVNLREDRASLPTMAKAISDALAYLDAMDASGSMLVRRNLKFVVVADQRGMMPRWRAYVTKLGQNELGNTFVLAGMLVWAACYIESVNSNKQGSGKSRRRHASQACRSAAADFAMRCSASDEWVEYFQRMSSDS
jgi:hypothetical protein